MTLTEEQFNKIATKDDLNDFVTKEEYQKGKDEILTAIDGIAKLAISKEEEQTANQAAHTRIQDDVNEVRKQIGMNIKHPTLSPEVA